jgi:hypothetical protein
LTANSALPLGEEGDASFLAAGNLLNGGLLKAEDKKGILGAE